MPDQNLGLVVELQANSPEDSNDPNELFSKGWTRIDLFDMSNRLLSGRYENSYIILIIISVGFFFFILWNSNLLFVFQVEDPDQDLSNKSIS